MTLARHKPRFRRLCPGGFSLGTSDADPTSENRQCVAYGRRRSTMCYNRRDYSREAEVRSRL